MPPAGFEPAIPASKRPQTHALDRAATGTGHPVVTNLHKQEVSITTIFVILLLLLVVFSPWAGLGRDQSSVRRLVWLWYAASWASS